MWRGNGEKNSILCMVKKEKKLRKEFKKWIGKKDKMENEIEKEKEKMDLKIIDM